jgi:prepilin-type N-terminal cleavage/methylation domain-containing protein
MPSVKSNKRAFTLFELLLVVVLIAVIYGIFVHKLSRTSETANLDKLSLSNLKKELSNLPFYDKAELICLEPCESCEIYLDDKPIKQEVISLFKVSPNVYKNNRFGQMEHVRFMPIAIKENELRDVCFRYTLYRNGSGSHIAVEHNSKYYLFDPVKYSVQVTSSISDVERFFDVSELLPTSTQDY